jgi:hypothetical protein
MSEMVKPGLSTTFACPLSVVIDVRFDLNSRHRRALSSWPLCAKRTHAPQQLRPQILPEIANFASSWRSLLLMLSRPAAQRSPARLILGVLRGNGGRLNSHNFANTGRNALAAHNQLSHNGFAHNQFAEHNFHGLNNFNHTGFNRNAFGNNANWNHWGGRFWGAGWNNWGWGWGCWAGPVFWPFILGDVFSFVFWPYGCYDPF